MAIVIGRVLILFTVARIVRVIVKIGLTDPGIWLLL